MAITKQPGRLAMHAEIEDALVVWWRAYDAVEHREWVDEHGNHLADKDGALNPQGHLIKTRFAVLSVAEMEARKALYATIEKHYGPSPTKVPGHLTPIRSLRPEEPPTPPEPPKRRA